MRKADPAKIENIRQRSLYTAARLFLERGYTHATVRYIAEEAGVNVTAMIRVLGTKEDILCHLVSYVLEGQFRFAEHMLKGLTQDPVLYYAAETTLQLYMAESSENVRDLYSAAYSLPESSELIRCTIAGKLIGLFGVYQPELSEQDFYELEIATGSIVRGYMTVPCSAEFPMETKVRRFLQSALRIYRVPEEKIEQAIAFVGQFDYPRLAQEIVAGMLRDLEAADAALYHDEDDE